MFVRGSHTFAMFYAHALREKTGNTRHVCAYYLDDLYPTCSKQHCREYANIVWLNHAFSAYLHVCSYTIWPDRAMEVIWKIFLLSVLTPLLHTK